MTTPTIETLATFKAALKEAITTRPTDSLLEMLDELDVPRQHEQHERMTYALIIDVVTEREGITEAVDRIYEDLDFCGTQTDAVRQALAETPPPAWEIERHRRHIQHSCGRQTLAQLIEWHGHLEKSLTEMPRTRRFQQMTRTAADEVALAITKRSAPPEN